MSTLRTNNVENLDGSGSLAFRFNSVDELKASTQVKVGQEVYLRGYYEPGDGGHGPMRIVDPNTGTDDFGTYIDLPGSGFQAEIVIEKNVSVARYGVIPGLFDGDHTKRVQNALDNSPCRVILLPFPATADDNGLAKWYNLTNIVVPMDKILLGDDIYASGKTWGDVDYNNELSRRVMVKGTGPVNTPVISVMNRAAALGFRMVDTRQKRSVTTSDEPWNDTQIAIRLGGDPAIYGKGSNNNGQSIGSITFLGFTDFIDQWTNDGASDPNSIGNLTLRSLFGIPHGGAAVNIAHSADICWAHDCQWIPHTVRSGWIQGDSQVYRYNLAKSSTGWKLGKADGFQFFGCQGLGLRYWFHSYRDAYPSDSNRGGGFNFDNCPVDTVGIGYKFDRDGGNDIGASIRGAQIIPVVYLGDEENTAFQFNGTTNINPGQMLSVFGVSIHTGGTHTGKLTPGDSNFFGTNSTKAPRYIAEFVNGAQGIHLSVESCRLQSYYKESIDWSQVANNNVVNFDDCHDRDRNPFNKKTVADGTGSIGSQEYILNESGNHITKWLTPDGSQAAKLYIAGGGLMRLDAGANVEIRAGVGSGNVYNAYLSHSTGGRWLPGSDGVQDLGGPNIQWRSLYTGDIQFANESQIYTAPGGEVRIDAKGSEAVLRSDVGGNNNRVSLGSGPLGAWLPGSDGTQSIGDAGHRWSEVFANNGTINTSDEREKQQISDLEDAELRVGAKLKIRRFKRNDSVESKGDANARWHFGFIAQEVVEAFESEGLDPYDYGVVFYMEWPEEPEVYDKDGNLEREARPAGNRYMIREGELHNLMASSRNSQTV